MSTDKENVDCSDETNEEPDVKSTAVVQYSRMEQPKLFHQLQQNFNLKLPPTNWLHGGTQWYKYMRNASLSKGHQFASFNMANCFPDLAGETDVISDAENIKKLLKIPYSKGHISMMVHRVGNTLMLDDFDIHRHLLRQQHNDWQWLRRFYEETVANTLQRERVIVKKNKSRLHLQNQNMFSKFLYYSAQDESKSGADRMESLEFKPTSSREYTTAGSLLPDPLPPQKPEFARTVRWTFEDIHMLVGSDLPIFGGTTHPCVSLRLKESSKPISVLTGMDYWLDNLMCNVPELAMCYHVDGIVQKYELIKTEEIPNMRESKFSPQVVKDIAQNILSFLKSNTTKEGHTYWLFKGQGDDIVKLYDLTTLCEPESDSDTENPFTVPVGILLYRVARNMWQTAGRKKAATIRKLLENCLRLLDKHQFSQAVTSAHLLLSEIYLSDDITNIAMLPPGDDACTSTGDVTDSGESTETDDDTSEVSSTLDDTITDPNAEDDVSNGNESTGPPAEDTGESRGYDSKEQSPDKPASPEKEQDTGDAIDQDMDPNMDQGPVVSVDVVALQKTHPNSSLKELGRIRAPPITGSVSERCMQALRHVAHGLACLDMNAATNAKSNSQRVDQQAECNPAEAIPMAYTREKTPPSPPCYGDISDSESNSLQVIRNSAFSGVLPSDSWHAWSKALLLLKAAAALFGLGEAKLRDGHFGDVMRLGKLVLQCYGAIKVLSARKAQEHEAMVPGTLKLLGDSELMLAHTSGDALMTHRDAFETLEEDELSIQESARAELKYNEFDWLDDFCTCAQAHFEQSVRIYEHAFRLAKNCHAINMTDIVKRLANALNELGVFYMNLASQQAAEQGTAERSQQLIDESHECFQRGIAHFEALQDKVNMALLHSNRGRLMRLRANHAAQYVHTGQRLREFSHAERTHFVRAQDEYHKALSLLDKRDTQPDIWDSMTWELSSTYFTMAISLQDFAPLSTMAQEQVEKEVTDLMHKALKYCDLESNSVRLAQCQYRAASIHHRLASLYHNAYRNQLMEQKKKHLRQLAELHYGKAQQLFVLVESTCDTLRLQLERVAMAEFQLPSVTSPSNRLKLLQNTLSHLLASDVTFATMTSQLETDENEAPGFRDEVGKLLIIFHSRLSFILHSLVKTSSSFKKGKPIEGPKPEVYKAMYGHMLKETGGLKTDTSEILSCVQCLHRVLQNVRDIYQGGLADSSKK